MVIDLFFRLVSLKNAKPALDPVASKRKNSSRENDDEKSKRYKSNEDTKNDDSELSLDQK